MDQPTWLWIASIPGCAVLTVITVNALRASIVATTPDGYRWPWRSRGKSRRGLVMGDFSGASFGLAVAGNSSNMDDGNGREREIANSLSVCAA